MVLNYIKIEWQKYLKFAYVWIDHDLEIVLSARKYKFIIKELPVKWHHVNQSKLNLIKDL